MISLKLQLHKETKLGLIARRLAHEIKNPLTPIQLSAERIDHKFSKQLEKRSNYLKRHYENHS